MKGKKMFHCRKTSLWLFVLLAFVSVTACSDPEEIQKSHTEESHTEESHTEEGLTRECICEHVTFCVGDSWTKIDDVEGAFLYPGNKAIYMLQGATPLGAGMDADIFYKSLVDFYSSQQNNRIDEKACEAMKPYTTSDGMDGYIGRITLTAPGDNGQSDIHHEIDVLVLPQKNYVVTFDAQCKVSDSLPVDIREITDTARIDIAKDDVTEGGVFVEQSTNTLLDLSTEGHFIMYFDKDDKKGEYVQGTCEIYRGQEAVEKVAAMTEYGITREELDDRIGQSMNGYSLNGTMPGNSADTYHVCEDSFYAMVFRVSAHHEKDGNVEQIENDTLYIGFYVEELQMLDMVNCKSFSLYRWKRQ